MHKKELKKIILSIIVIILFSLVLVTIFSFNKNSENIEFNGANNIVQKKNKTHLQIIVILKKKILDY